MNTPPLLGAIEGGGTKFVCAVGMPGTALLASTTVATTSPAATLAGCIDFFTAARREHGPIAALGIGCFGPLQLDPAARDHGCLINTPKRGWSGTNLVTPLVTALGVPVALDVDVGAAAMAEWQLGAGRELASLAYVTVGTGIGGAMVPRDGSAHLMHAELGHLPLRRDALDAGFAGVCPFHRDCAEGLASGPAIRARWNCDLEALPAEHFGRELIAGYLGQLGAAIALMLSPHCIVLGGGVMHEASMLQRVQQATATCLAGYLPPLAAPGRIGNYLLAPALGTASGITGALLLAQRALQNVPLTRNR